MAEVSEIEAGGEVRTVKDTTARKGLVYSTDETDTGKKWINGKPIYRKVYSGNYSSGIILAVNVEDLVSASGWIGLTTNKTAFPFGSPSNYVSLSVNSQHNIVTYANASYSNACIVVEYTKTTN